MESAKDLPSDTLSVLRARAKIPPLTFDNDAKLDGDDTAAIASSSASSPSASMSPRTPADNGPLSATEPPPDSPSVEGREPSSGPQRTRSASSGSSKTGESKEKRKRSRVTPEQLAHLERFFAADRSPTAARRREISELLGMQERQTQIWFQNRRAKAKLLDGKRSRHGDWSDTPPDTPPQLSAGFEADLQNLIHEDYPISIIPCSDLSIGTWRRIATPAGKHDLISYVCEAKRCLTWFIHSAGYGFKMEIPFDIITHTEFRNAAPGEGLASFTLSQPPIFYLEHISSPQVGGSLIKTWKKCSDWTEGTQASRVLRHDLVGSAVLLAHVLQDLQNYRTRSNIRLLNPSAYATGDPSGAGLQLPQPPLVSLQGDAYSGPMLRPSYFGHSRKRSNSGPPAFAHGASAYVDHTFPTVNTSSVSSSAGPHSAGFATTSFSGLQERPPSSSMPYGQNYDPRMVGDFMSADVQQPTVQSPHQRQSPISDYSNVPISHSSTHRSFTNTPSSQQFAFPQGRTSPPFQLSSFQRQSASTTTQQSSFATPSPPLLAGSYQPQPDSSAEGSLPNMPEIGGTLAQPRAQGPPLPPLDMSTLPTMSYYGQDGVQSHIGEYSAGHADGSSLVVSLGSSNTPPLSSAGPHHNPLSSTLD